LPAIKTLYLKQNIVLLASKTDKRELIVIAIKLIASCIFASYFLLDYFAPFVEYQADHLLENPYNHFYELGNYKAFPYGSVMLYLLLAGQLLMKPFILLLGHHTLFTMLGFGIITLAFDVLIYQLLIRWFPTLKNKIFVLYFCSPIIFYITYFHRQLDIIPIGLLLLSMHRLNTKNHNSSAILMGLAVNAKSNILLAIPFVLIYLFRNKEPKLGLRYLLITVVTYSLFYLPYMQGAGYSNMVFKASEQSWLFDFGIPFGNKGLVLLLGPVFLALLFLNYISYGRISRDAMFMYIGLAFMLLVTFVSPMPGWYMWSYPFIIYAYLKYTDFPKLPLAALHLAYFIYFVFHSNNSFFSSFTPLIGETGTNWTSFGLQYSTYTDSILFIPLAAIMFYLMVLMFLLGIKNNQLSNFRKHPYLIGIGGDSGTGKHTLANLFKELFAEKNILQINGDADHKWERGHEKWQAFTHLNPKANNLFIQFTQTQLLKQGRTIERLEYDHNTGKFTKPSPIKPNTYVLFVGLHPYFIPQMRSLFDLKIYMDTDEALRIKWKMKRDQEKRGYSEEKIKEQIANRLPDAEKYIKPQAKHADLIIKYVDEDEQQNLKAEYTISTKWNIDSLLEYFEDKEEKKNLEHFFDEQFEMQKIIYYGTVSDHFYDEYLTTHADDLEDLGYANFTLQKNTDGFTQLLVLCMMAQQRKHQ
jgi:uridine kinase